MYIYSYSQEIRCNFAIAVDSFDMKTARKILQVDESLQALGAYNKRIPNFLPSQRTQRI